MVYGPVGLSGDLKIVIGLLAYRCGITSIALLLYTNNKHYYMISDIMWCVKYEGVYMHISINFQSLILHCVLNLRNVFVWESLEDTDILV